MRNHKSLYIITLLILSTIFVNIHLALAGVLCMTIPFYLLVRDRKKTWCQGYCPRASLFMTAGKFKGKKMRKVPKMFIDGSLKKAILIYFGISLFVITMSTLRVARGGMPPMLYPKFLIVVPLNFGITPLFPVSGIAPWITHLAFRLYSMTMTSTILGLIMGALYRPRTWCSVCPVNTVSDIYLMKKSDQVKTYRKAS